GRVRSGDHAIDHFALQHEDAVGEAIGDLGHLEQDRRRDVVGKVSHDAQRRWQLAQVEVEDIAFVDGHAAVAVDEPQVRGELAVDLDHVQAIHDAGELPREQARSRADLDHGVARLRRDRLHDAREVVGVCEEVLAEALARLVLHRYRRRAISQASAIAACRLPASISPAPARSSAVPWSTDVLMSGSPSVTFTASPNAACFSTGRPWSWNMASAASPLARVRGVKSVSAGYGPETPSPSRRALWTAGAITSISSRPR